MSSINNSTIDNQKPNDISSAPIMPNPMLAAGLGIPLKKKWFDMTKAGIKTEDYREITPYWCSRLCKSWYPSGSENPLDWLIYFKNFDYNIMTLGYPSNNDTSRILKLEHKGIEIRTGNPEWGAEPDKLYFVILHGDIIA